MSTDDRRTAVRDQLTVNGLDFLEVDPASPTHLVVHFIHNLPGAATSPVPPGGAVPTRDDFAVEGGERIVGVRVVSATVTADNQVTVAVDQEGDFSVYTLVLAAPGGLPLAGYDPRCGSVDFLFHVECAKTFDCAPRRLCPPEVHATPRIDYLAKDYPGFVRVMLDRLSLLAPGWPERHAADLGVALVEALAYVGDHLSYRQDAIATEAYLSTARLRTSARRHARLVDYRVGEGANARAWLRVRVNADVAPGLAPGSRCVTGYPSGGGSLLAHTTRAYQDAVNAGAVFFETVGGSGPLFLAHAEMPLYNWSDAEACLAPGATRATLRGPFPNLRPGMVLVLAEARGPRTASPADADPARRQAVRLIRVGAPGTDPVPTPPVAVTEIEWHPEDALTFPLCIASVTDAGHGAAPIVDVSVAWGNVVLADQGLTVGHPGNPLVPQPEPVGTVPPHGRFRPRLARSPVTFAASPPDPNGPAAAARSVTVDDARPVVALHSTDADGNPGGWSPALDLLETGIDAGTPAFVPEIESDATAYLRFGDGVNGQAPPPGTAFVARYRIGNGSGGNVAAGAITLLDADAVQPGVAGVLNPMPAWGGTDPEPVEHVRQSAPVAFRSQRRAVTAEDYRTVALGFPGVRRAAATFRWTGSWQTVFLTVERQSGAALDPTFIGGLTAYVDGFRMAGYDLEVADARRVPLLVAMHVCAKEGYLAIDVGRALDEVFSNQVLPDGTLGMFHPERLDLGQPVYLSPLYARAQGIDGVASVRIDRFERQDSPSDDGLRTGVLTPERLELFVLENNPDFPERGLFELTVEGGL
jgi:hypothetical protein